MNGRIIENNPPALPSSVVSKRWDMAVAHGSARHIKANAAAKALRKHREIDDKMAAVRQLLGGKRDWNPAVIMDGNDERDHSY